MPITHAQVTGADTSLEVGDKVLGNTASAILQVRDHLNRDSIDQAIRVVSDADRVEFYGVGHFGSLRPSGCGAVLDYFLRPGQVGGSM